MTLSRRGAAALLVAACAACYATALGGTFHYDDFHSIVDNRALRDAGNLPDFFVDPGLFSADAGKAMYRPLLLVTYAANHAVAGYEPWAWLAANLALHMAAVLLLWGLAVHLLGHGWRSLVAGLLFAVHPLTSEPVNYVSSRSELLAAALYLAAFLAHVRAGQRGRWVAVALFVLALLSKSTAVTLPVALLIYEMVSAPGRSNWRGAWHRARSLWAYWAAAAAYVALISANGFLGTSLASPVRAAVPQVATQTKALAYYLKLLAVPWGLSVEHQFAESGSLVHGPVLAAAALVASLLAVALAGMRWGRGATGPFAVLWAGLVLLPTSIIPLNVLVNERRLYLVVAALSLGLAALARVRERWMLVACLPVLAALTMARNPLWASELTLWRDAAARGPHMARVQANLGKALQQAGDAEAALAAYERALALDPSRGDVYNNIGTLLHSRGHLDAAMTWYRRGLAAYPQETEILLNLAQAQAAAGDLVTSLDTYRRAVGLDPDNGPAWSNYAEALLQAGEWAEARAAAERAIALAPERPEPYNNLANALSAQGRDEAAVEAYRQALDRAESARGPILANLGDSLRRLGELDEARRALGQAVAAEPALARAHYFLGRVEADAGRPELAAAALQRAVALDSAHVPGLLALAEVEAELGRQEAALALTRRALALEPDNPRAWYTRAELHEVLGQPREAHRAYRSFLEYWPTQDSRYERARARIRALEGEG